MSITIIICVVARGYNSMVARAASSDDVYVDALTTMILARDIISPTNVAVEAQVTSLHK